MLHATWKRVLHDKGRLALTVLAVALGVTFLTASLVLAGSTRSALHDSYAQVYAGADVVVRGPETFGEETFVGGAAPLGDAALDRILAVPGVEAAEGRIRSVAQLVPAGGGEGEDAVAEALPSSPARAAIAVRSGRLPQRDGEVAVDAAVAAGLDVGAGDRVRVLVPGAVADAEVVGTVGFGPLDGLAGGARVLFDPATGAALFGDGGYAEIAVRTAEGVTPGQVGERLADALGEDASVLTAAQAAERDAAAAARQTAVISWIVGAVAVVALVVGAFLVANTFRMLVGQRLRELALLRAVGASRRQVARSLRVEAALIGALGALLGVGLGVGTGVLLVTASSGLVPGMPPASPTVPPAALLAGPVVGVGVAVLAARGAARRALAVPPVAALRTLAAASPSPSRLRLLAGPALLAAGAATTIVAMRADAAALLAAGAGGLILGFGLIFPLVTGPVLGLLSRPLARAGVTGALAREQTLAAPRRTGATAAALAVGLALVSFLLVLNASLGTAVPQLLAARQHAEWTIRPTARQGLHDFLFDAADRADRLDSVAAARVVTYGELRVTDPTSDESRPRAAAAYVVDPAAVAELFDVRGRAGDVASVAEGEIAVRHTVAEANGWQVADRLRVEFPDGFEGELTVTALFDGEITTDWIAAPETAETHLPNASREAFVKLVDDADPAAARASLEGVLAGHPAASLLSRDEQAAEAVDANAGSLGVLTAAFSLSLVVGVLGVVNTLTLAVVERVRELGLLRAVGATRSQVRALIRWEALLTSILGAGLGAALGLSLAWIATQALPTPVFTVPGWHVAAAVAATGLLGVIAAVVPSIRAARVDVLRAIQSE